MMPRRTVEISVGLFIAAGLAALFMLAMKVSNLTGFADDGGYNVTAYFDNIGGLKVRSPVTIAGVLVGRVSAIEYDSSRYQARIILTISPRFRRLPTDTSAGIYTAGLLGEQYVGLEPGGEERYLKAGDEIHLTQSALVMEQLIGQFLFDKAQEGSEP